MKILCLFAMMVSLMGCAEDDTWHGDPAFSPEERAAIEDGATFAAENTGEEAPVIVWDWDGDTSTHYIQRAKPDAEVSHGQKWIAYSTNRRMVITPDRATAAIAAHEWGHVYGLDHVDSGMMQASQNELTWTDSDHGECKLRHHLHCKKVRPHP